MTPFKYSRKKEVQKKDAQGNPIPLKQRVPVDIDGDDEEVTHEEVIVPGKFETEFVWKTDYINLDLFIRTHELDNGKVIVLLSDGHHEDQRVPVSLKNPKKGFVEGNVVERKETVWVQSEITLEKPEEIAKLYEVLEAYI